MTTTVIIEVHCDPATEEVVVGLTDWRDESPAIHETTLQDGDRYQMNVYDGRQVTVMERQKGGANAA